MNSTQKFLAMIFNEIECHVNTCLGLVGAPSPASPLCPRLVPGLKTRRARESRALASSHKSQGVVDVKVNVVGMNTVAPGRNAVLCY